MFKSRGSTGILSQLLYIDSCSVRLYSIPSDYVMRLSRILLTLTLFTALPSARPQQMVPDSLDDSCFVSSDPRWTPQEKFVWERVCVGEDADFNATAACIAVSSACRLSLPATSRSRQNLPTPPLHSRSRADIASLNAACAAATVGVRRDARASVTSAMLVLAKPTPAVTAKTNVIAHTAHPTSEGARCRACQSLAAQEGTTSATRSAATPMARNNHPAASLSPSERANIPFMAMPTPARARAATSNRIREMLRDGASPSRATSCTVTVGGGVKGGSANAESADERTSGIGNSEDEDGDSSFVGAAAFRLGRLRCL
jgi:hypothetical protein